MRPRREHALSKYSVTTFNTRGTTVTTCSPASAFAELCALPPGVRTFSGQKVGFCVNLVRKSWDTPGLTLQIDAMTSEERNGGEPIAFEVYHGPGVGYVPVELIGSARLRKLYDALREVTPPRNPKYAPESVGEAYQEINAFLSEYEVTHGSDVSDNG